MLCTSGFADDVMSAHNRPDKGRILSTGVTSGVYDFLVKFCNPCICFKWVKFGTSHLLRQLTVASTVSRRTRQVS